jgi:hypothetical protein
VLVCPNIPVGVSIRHILADGSLLAQQNLSAGPHPDTPRQPSLL